MTCGIALPLGGGKPLAAKALDVFRRKLGRLATIQLVNALPDFRLQLFPADAAEFFAGFEQVQSRRNDLAVRQIRARLHRILDEALVFIAERNG